MMKNLAESATLLDMFYHWEREKPSAAYLRQPVEQNWIDYTWAEVGEQARRIASAMRPMGLTRGQRVSILSKNCAHWLIADLATMMSGCSSAPVFTTMTGDDVKYCLEHSDARVLNCAEY